jgi:CHAT domain-containing protein
MIKSFLKLFLIFFYLSSTAQVKEDFNFKKADSLLKIYQEKSQLDSVAIQAKNIYLAYNKIKKYEEAIHYVLKEVNLGKEGVLDSLKYKNSLYNLGHFYYMNNQFDKSISILKNVINNFSVDKKTFQSYIYIARNLYKVRYNYQAIIYYKKGLENKKILDKKTLFNAYINLSIVYKSIDTKQSLKERIKLLEKAEEIYNELNLKDNKFYILYNNISVLYSSKYNYSFDKYKYYSFKIINKASINKDSSILSTTYNNLASIYIKEKNDSAYFYLKKGIQFTTKKSYTSIKLQRNFAQYYFNKDNTHEALKRLHESIQSALSRKIDSNYFNVPELKDISISNNKMLILYSLIDKAEYTLNDIKLNKEKKFISFALENLILADKLLDIIKEESLEQKSKLFWQEEASEFYMLGVQASFKLDDTEQAFYFMEKNKALLLLENINENEVRKHINLPNDILEKELQLKKKINEYENELISKNSQKDSIEKKYYTAKIEHQTFIESLKKKSPEYYNLKKTKAIISLKSVKNELDIQSILLEYIINDKEGFLLATTKNKSKIFKIDSISNTLKTLDNYLSLIARPLKTKTELDSFKALSNNLYQLLFPLQDESFMNGINKLIIIPDYTLQNLPFETLKTNSNNYLINDYEISYAYSMSFLKENKKLNRQAKNIFLGFTPSRFKNESLEDLPRSKSEIENIKQILNGDNFKNQDATKENFFKKLNSYKIIHLATHANANDSISPWIAFKNEKLYLNELYTSKNQAELVVLSACNTSLGKIKPGEGVYSLARGFFYSGANSVISSLWNVNDKSTQEITTSFYKYLKKGSSKSQALRQAKLEYLNTHSLSEVSPYYWSSLILIGDNSAIHLRNNSLYYIILSVSLFLFLFFILKKLKIVGNKS